MHGTWTLSWHAVMLTLLLHIVLYVLVFLACAFFAARPFRRMRNPVHPPRPTALLCALRAHMRMHL